uniref:RxLR effector candidate protein n=1 Tax=Hyaloperonospora arabidopsidis (strain Emoy2) TaxID=559515 RepID=M4BZW2_HYAAE
MLRLPIAVACPRLLFAFHWFVFSCCHRGRISHQLQDTGQGYRRVRSVSGIRSQKRSS